MLRSQTSASPRHVSLVLSSGDAASPTTSYPLAPRLPTAPAIQHHRSPRHTPPSARARQVRLHGGRGRLHLTVQRLRSVRSEAEISGPPSRPLAPLGADRRTMSAPKADGLGRRSQAAGGRQKRRSPRGPSPALTSRRPGSARAGLCRGRKPGRCRSTRTCSRPRSPPSPPCVSCLETPPFSFPRTRDALATHRSLARRLF